MPIRPLALLDLPYIYGFRDEAVGLDTARLLTRGNPLGYFRHPAVHSDQFLCRPQPDVGYKDSAQHDFPFTDRMAFGDVVRD